MCIKTMDKKFTRITLSAALVAIIALLCLVAFAAPAPAVDATTTDNVVVETTPAIFDSPAVTTESPDEKVDVESEKVQLPPDTTPPASTTTPAPDYTKEESDTSTPVEDEPIVFQTMEQKDLESFLFYDTSYEQIQHIAKMTKRDTIKTMDVVCTYIDDTTVSFTYDNRIFCLPNNGQWQLGMIVTMYFIV